MSDQISLVVTTIGDGAFLNDYAAAAEKEQVKGDLTMIVIPDKKTPAGIFEQAAALRARGFAVVCPTVEEQDAYLAKLGKIKEIVPYNSDNRRNIGYLMAYEKRCDVMISIDDDNFPRQDFFRGHLVVNQQVSLETLDADLGWYNICELLEIDTDRTYPRGFPYKKRHQPAAVTTKKEAGVVRINAGLWLGHPDIDAVSCLHGPTKATSFRGRSFFLGRDTWSPLNTQNTAMSRDAIAAYYFAKMGYPLIGLSIDRYGDIFSGYFLQACARQLGHRIRVGTPIVDHRRNSHNYLKDLTQELACILMLEEVTDWLHDLKLSGSDYPGSYAALADALAAQADKFQGFIWTDASREYLRVLSQCLKTWLGAVKTLA